MDNLDTLALDSDAPASPGFDLWGLVNRRKWLILTGVILGLLGGVGYFFVAPRVYESVAQIIVYRQSAALPTDRLTPKSSAGNVEMLSKEVLSTELMRLSSMGVLSSALHNPKYEIEKLQSLRSDEQPLQTIYEHLSVTKGGEGLTQDANVINISFRCGNSSDAQKVVEAIIDSYKTSLGSDFENQGARLLGLIADARNKLGEEIKRQAELYRQFRLKAPTTFLGPERQNHVDSLSGRMAAMERFRGEIEMKRMEVQTQLNALVEAEKKGENREALMLMVERQLGRVDTKSGQMVELMQNSYFPLLQRRDTLAQTYGPDHPIMQGINKQIDTFRDMFKDEVKKRETASGSDLVANYIDSLKTELAKYTEQEKYLNEQLVKENENARKLMELELQDQSLRDELKQKKELYDAVVQQVEEVSLMKGMGGTVTQVITPPGPGQQVAPSLPVSLLAGMVVGFMLFFGIGYLIDWSDKSFRNAEEIRGSLRAPVMGHIPIILTDEEEEAGRPGQLDPILASYHLPNSRYAEAYRSVRTALYFSTHGQRHKVIQITSPMKNDGKSTLAANLAISIAQSGKRVLLLDADFRRPRLHELFGVANENGLSSVITHEMEIPEVVLGTPIQNLWLLPSGKKPDNPAELLTSTRFKELLETLKESYDYVLVDTPPVLAVTDSSVVAAFVDGVILGVQITRRSRPNAMAAVDRLQTIGARVIGVVVNGVGWQRSLAYRYAGKFGSESRYYRVDGENFSFTEPHYYSAANGAPARERIPALTE